MVDFIESTADAVSTWEIDRDVGVDGFERVERDQGEPGRRFLDRPEPLERLVARHVRLEADTAAHRRAEHVLAVRPCIACEVTLGLALRHLVALSHDQAPFEGCGHMRPSPF